MNTPTEFCSRCNIPNVWNGKPLVLKKFQKNPVCPNCYLQLRQERNKLLRKIRNQKMKMFGV